MTDPSPRTPRTPLESLAVTGAAMTHLQRLGILSHHDDGTFWECMDERCVRNRATLAEAATDQVGPDREAQIAAIAAALHEPCHHRKSDDHWTRHWTESERLYDAGLRAAHPASPDLVREAWEDIATNIRAVEFPPDHPGYLSDDAFVAVKEWIIDCLTPDPPVPAAWLEFALGARAAHPASPDLPTELRALSDAATPGPWDYNPDFPAEVAADYEPVLRASKNHADAEFIVAAVNWLRSLLDSDPGTPTP